MNRKKKDGDDNSDDGNKKDSLLDVFLGVGAAVGAVVGAAAIGYGTYKLAKYVQQPSLNVDDIGVNFNEWRIPREINNQEMKLAKQLCDASDSELNIEEAEWNKATKAVNKVLDLLMPEIKSEAAKYEGLVIEKYVKQGSSREGLKVHAADEFDVLLQFHFENIDYEVEPVQSGANVLPELAYLSVNSTMKELSFSHEKLHRKGVFCEMQGDPYISTMALQEKVFKSIIAMAADRVVHKINHGRTEDTLGFRISLRTNPPSVNIRIQFTESEDPLSAIFKVLEISKQSSQKVIDVDIVPGLLISDDTVPDPTNKRRTMKCPKYAVFKWFTENHRSATGYEGREFLWRLCSSGYEKHVMDVARGKQDQCHIVTALRFLKLYFRNGKHNAIGRNEPPPQVVTVLRSYHLKHVAFYCILFLRVINKEKLSSVDDALTYMLEFLGVCLEERRLPHFFHANRYVTSMFPSLKSHPRELKYDLFQSKRGDALNQAMLSYRTMADVIFSVIKRPANTHRIVQQFRSYISSGNYFQ